jgi:hypothetical protein
VARGRLDPLVPERLPISWPRQGGAGCLSDGRVVG